MTLRINHVSAPGCRPRAVATFDGFVRGLLADQARTATLTEPLVERLIATWTALASGTCGAMVAAPLTRFADDWAARDRDHPFGPPDSSDLTAPRNCLPWRVLHAVGQGDV